MAQEPIATGKVVSLCVNGEARRKLWFCLDGPQGDTHTGFCRLISGHDTVFLQTSKLQKRRHQVLNLRSWTGLSQEEVREVEADIGVRIPQGILQENITVSGIPSFSQLAPMSRLVFPARGQNESLKQAILLITEENGPCVGVGQPLEDYHKIPGLKTEFIRAAQHKRGVMGMVYSAGVVEIGDEVLVYPPVM